MLRFIVLLLVLGFVTSPLWILALALDASPRVLEAAPLSIDDVGNAKRLLRENDPRQLRDGERKQVVLTERELNLVSRYALPEGSAARVGLKPDLVTIAASARVPVNLLGSHINAEIILAQIGQTLEPIALSVGHISLPGWMAGSLHAMGDKLLRSQVPEYKAILESLESIQVDDGALTLNYQWNAELVERLTDRGRGLVVTEQERENILAYYAGLEEMTRTLPRRTPLAEVMGALFAQAESRSNEGANARDENRALILALGMVLKRADPNGLLSRGQMPVPVAGPLRVTLRGRHDLARHFGISAALAVSGGSELANVMGVFKELSDSRGGSGFSFPDLLADRAGVVFAEKVTGSGARRFQRLLAGESDEALFMPPVDTLPEGLQELEFRGRYEDLGTAAYNQVREEVERRIDGLALYQ